MLSIYLCVAVSIIVIEKLGRRHYSRRNDMTNDALLKEKLLGLLPSGSIVLLLYTTEGAVL